LFILDRYWRSDVGYELTITEVYDDKPELEVHGDDSMHYDDPSNALDIRTWTAGHNGHQIHGTRRASLLEVVRTTMGSEFEVIDEGTHFHIELRNRP
jgi:hypothetical protein